MPELPEVETARRLAVRVAVGRRIVRVDCARDPIVLDGVAPEGLRRALEGREVRAVRRRGKHLWLELDRRPWPAIHFGMTGSLSAPDAGWPPRYTKLRLAFDDGGELAFADPRRLGRVRLRRDPRNEPPIRGLGFDALVELPAPARFRELVRQRGAPIKAVLLDQSFAAGVGNWIADEVLYQARLDPHRRASTLSDAEIARLRARLRSVLATSVRLGADGDRYPRTWLFHTRWERGARAVTARGERIRHETIGGRTAAWVPAVQR